MSQSRAGGPSLNPRPFLHAFLRYEVGAPPPSVRRGLRRTATGAFARQLLADPPDAAGDRVSARIARLRITRLSEDPPRALIAGTAIRATGPEPFAFLFEARRGRWLAAGPAE